MYVQRLFTLECVHVQWACFPSYWFDEALGFVQGWLQVMAGAVVMTSVGAKWTV